MRHGLILVAIAAAAAAAAPAGAFTGPPPTVTITPPSGPSDRSYPNDFRTTDQQPLFRIDGTGGTALRCNLDDSGGQGTDAFTPCGARATPCLAQACFSYMPPAALGNGLHTLAVELEDAHGNAVADSSLDFDVDTTPPDTIGVSADGPALRPMFSFTVDEDDPLAPADSARCSFTKVSSPPLWTSCATGLSLSGTGLDGGYRPPFGLPRRHADYLFEARSIDDFGRMDPTPARYVYDPIPCAVEAQPASLPQVLAAGLPLTVSCSSVHRVRLDVRLAGRHGRSVGGALISHRGERWSLHRTLRLSRRSASMLRSDASATLVVGARDAAPDTNRLPAYSAVTVRR